MEIQKLNSPLMSNQLVLEQAKWDLYLARLISTGGSPLLLGALALMLATASSAHPARWWWAAAYMVFIVVVPIAFIVYLVKQGRASDYDLSVRKERILPMLVNFSCGAIGWGLLSLGNGPQLLTVLAAANAILTAVLMLVTLTWKISMHTAVSAALGVVLWVLLGTRGMVFCVVVVPLIAWSRVRLERHTVAQTVMGAIVGALVFSATILVHGV